LFEASCDRSTIAAQVPNGFQEAVLKGSSSMLKTTRRLRIAAAGAVVAAGLTVPAAPAAAACANANVNPHDMSRPAAKRATLCVINEIRRARGLHPFDRNIRLGKASQRHTNAMERRKYFLHGDFVGRIRSAGYLSGVGTWAVGENIAWGSYDLATPRAIVRGWMHSPPHRRSMLSSRFRDIGIGITRGAPVRGVDRAAIYATDFGTRG
jgi:uncharacterized protein YkwD